MRPPAPTEPEPRRADPEGHRDRAGARHPRAGRDDHTQERRDPHAGPLVARPRLQRGGRHGGPPAAPVGVHRPYREPVRGHATRRCRTHRRAHRQRTRMLDPTTERTRRLIASGTPDRVRRSRRVRRAAPHRPIALARRTSPRVTRPFRQPIRRVLRGTLLEQGEPKPNRNQRPLHGLTLHQRLVLTRAEGPN
ncbi:hypothetical protein HKW67_03470 [Gemmatimonas groenlandica]|uniref:Uncharacterized protein n=1 Tax=Gemmatimonas groenlandica TaxID=2732249 RepID=A0A6M4IWY8_9BACT|nr:hypothetical protein HKW67_03470 [Gemmatimonas groenlandica]